jgi:hypothetical protein
VTATARYVYAVTRGLPGPSVDGLTGLRGSPVELVPHGDLQAVVTDVPLPEFSEQGLLENLEQLPWLEEVARTHDDVVRAVTAHAPTAPLRLATIFHDDDAVRSRLDEWREALVEVLDRIDGRAEWSVKVLAPPVPGRTAAADDAPASGAEFLRRKKAQAGDAAARQEASSRVAQSVHHELAAIADASRLLPAQDPQLTGHVGQMVLNGAYLVADSVQDTFAERVDALRMEHDEVTLEAGGPWPPYSFAVLEVS